MYNRLSNYTKLAMLVVKAYKRCQEDVRVEQKISVVQSSVG